MTGFTSQLTHFAYSAGFADNGRQIAMLLMPCLPFISGA